MVNGLVLLVQVGLLALLVLLALRMVALVRSEPMAAGHQEFWSGKAQATGHDLSSGSSEWPVAVRKPVLAACFAAVSSTQSVPRATGSA